MNKQFARVWVGFTLVFIVLELTYINAKSLNYLSGGSSVSDGAFAVLGSIAFSMVTVLIMMLSKRQWLKVVFPLFDAALLFGGFNIHNADNLLENPVRFYVTIFFAVFTGVITYSLGQINAEQYMNDESKLNQLESNRINLELEEKINELTRINVELSEKYADSNSIVNESINEANESKLLAEKFIQGHIQWENFIGKKKKERNGYEASIERLAEQVKSGKTITIQQYVKEVTNV